MGIRELIAQERAALHDRTRGSEAMLRRAGRTLVGGVPSSFQLREPWPIYLSRGEGPRVWDVDGNEYLDFHLGFSSMLAGHANPAIGAALAGRHPLGAHFAAPTEDAVVVAEELARRFGLPRWRFTNSGTESTMAAIRLARAHTGRDGVVTIAGAYHGHHDVAMAGRSAGIPRSTAELVAAVEWGDADAMERRLARPGRAPACVLMEPALTSRGLLPPEPGYLEAVREITRRHGVLLILDEVKTGLSFGPGGATARLGLAPDLVTLAKALGGGLPSGAIGMTAELARLVDEGEVPQFGTYNGNPLVMAAARANLLDVLTPAAYERLERLGKRLLAGCEQVVAEHALAARCDGIGAKGSVILDDAELAELAWPWGMNRGVFTTHGRPPEWTLSVAHGQDAVDRYLQVFADLARAVTRRSSGSALA